MKDTVTASSRKVAIRVPVRLHALIEEERLRQGQTQTEFHVAALRMWCGQLASERAAIQLPPTPGPMPQPKKRGRPSKQPAA